MYRAGEWVVYGSTGVCQVMAVGPAEAGRGLEKGKEYYQLSPLLDSSVIYAPVDTKVFMRPVISRQEAEELLEGAANLEEDICYSRNLRLLTEHYKEALQTHQCEDLLRIIRAVYVKNQACAKNGKRPGQIDQRYMKRAEELLHSELSVALHIPYEEVPDYIAQVIARAEASAG